MTELKTKGAFASSPERDRKDIVLPSGRSATVLETTGEAERLLSTLQQNRDLAVINREERMELVNLCDNFGVSKDQFLAHLKSTYNINTTAEIRKQDFESIGDWIRSQGDVL